MLKRASYSSFFEKVLLLFSVLCYASTRATAVASEPAQHSSSALGRFFSFIEDPPPIAEIVYRIRKPFQSTNGSSYFEGRWQSNGLFLRKLSSANDVNGPVPGTNGLCIGLFGSNWWHFDGSGDAIYEMDSPETLGSQKNSPLRFAQLMLSEVLNMGIPDQGIAAIKWQSNHFESVSMMMNVRYTGDIQSTFSNGLPKLLRVENRYQGQVRRFRTEYEYDRTFPIAYVPSKMTTQIEWSGKLVPYSDIDIIALRIGSGPLGPEAFDPRRYLTVANRIMYRSNSVLYEIKHGQMIKVRADFRRDRLGSRPRLYYYSVVALSGAIAVWLITIKARRESGETTTGRRAIS